MRVAPVTPTKVAGTLRRAVRSYSIARILGGRHMECAYYFDLCNPTKMKTDDAVLLPWLRLIRRLGKDANEVVLLESL